MLNVSDSDGETIIGDNQSETDRAVSQSIDDEDNINFGQYDSAKLKHAPIKNGDMVELSNVQGTQLFVRPTAADRQYVELLKVINSTSRIPLSSAEKGDIVLTVFAEDLSRAIIVSDDTLALIDDGPEKGYESLTELYRPPKKALEVDTNKTEPSSSDSKRFDGRG